MEIKINSKCLDWIKNSAQATLMYNYMAWAGETDDEIDGEIYGWIEELDILIMNECPKFKTAATLMLMLNAGVIIESSETVAVTFDNYWVD